ncbi:DUF2867 domain-containing protein [Pontimicrobium sp. SW4]|uniref:DUF2867 domain-containing protein n=1 Tax=Pontimicrobium sp. SW4 TaxID=3153519 RepID=A0AAU7BVD2_9FLAO
MKVKVERTPKTEGIKYALPQVNFTDTFSTTNHLDSLSIISKLVFGTMPKWVGFLMKIRNNIVKVFGLKTEKPEDYHPEFKVGGYVGFFQIFSIQHNEIILGADDKHLNFRVSIYNSNENQFNIKVTTLVEYNNRFGKIYMFIVKPFHHFIVKKW